MRASCSRASLSLLASLTLSACALRLTPPKPLETAALLSPAEALARALARVDERGLVDYESLRQDASSLNAFLTYVAAFSPDSDPDRFPSAASRLAYYLNVYNALVLYAVTDSDVRPKDEKRFYRRTKMMVGGSLRTLSDIEASISELKDARAYFALCGGAKGHPRLGPAPYEAGTLEAQLDKAARDFLDDPRNVAVDRAKKVVRLSEVLRRRKKVLLDRAETLAAYANRFREDKVPENYKVEFLPFDWSLNSKEAPAPAANPKVDTPKPNLP